MNFKGIFRGTLLTMILTALSLFIGAVLVYFDILTGEILYLVFLSFYNTKSMIYYIS